MEIFTRLSNFVKDFVRKHKKPLLIILGAVVFLWALIRLSPYPSLNKFIKQSWSTRFYDSSGALIQVIPLENGIRKEFTAFEEIPEVCKNLFLLSEDKDFYKHNGVDFSAIVRASFQNTTNKRTVSGASTIDMQLVRIISKTFSRERNLGDKLIEVFNSVRIESRLSKDKIFELYLNTVPFGFGVEGITSACRRFYNTTPQKMNIAQWCSLAVIPRRPASNNPLNFPQNNAELAFQLYKKLIQNFPEYSNDKNYIYSEQNFLQITSLASSYKYPYEFPHLIRYITSNWKNEGKSFPPDFFLTLNSKTQNKANLLLKTELIQTSNSRLNNGAVFVIENQTGNILAWVGSRDFFDKENDSQIDGVITENQPGSSMKPFLYALALENGWMPNSILPDIPSTFGSNQAYIPQNFNNKFNGPIRFRVALASSLNIPAVYLLSQIGMKKYIKKLEDLGFKNIRKNGEEAGLGLALGNAPVSLYDLVSAFSVFSRDGISIPLNFENSKREKNKTDFSKNISNYKDGKQVYSSDNARIICSILSDKFARVLGFGTMTYFDTPFPSIFKTGTANQFQNITALASSKDYTIGVWMGNFSGETVVGKTGSSIPAKICREMLIFLEKGNDINNFAQPEKWEKTPICPLSGMACGNDCPNSVFEYIPVGTHLQKCNWHKRNAQTNKIELTLPSEYREWGEIHTKSFNYENLNDLFEIVKPNDGTIFYLDTRLPVEHQIVPVSVEIPEDSNVVIYYDNEIIKEGIIENNFYLPMTVGEHELVMIDLNTENKSRITFSVR